MTLKTPRKLLLPVDGSPCAEYAARYLAAYARQLGPSLAIVLNVRDGAERTEPAAPDKSQVVHTTCSILNEAGVAHTRREETGDPVQTILRVATEEAADEIIMGSRGLGQWKGVVVGSVAYRVLQQTTLPVTMAGTASQAATHPEGAPAHAHRILLAVDGSWHALRATEYVCRLQDAGLPLEVELLTVVGPIPPGYLHEFITREKLDFHYRQEGARALFEARAALETAGVKFRQHIVAGYVVEKILNIARLNNCTRIVMGSRGAGPMADLLLGSVAYQAIHLSPIPVTLVR